MNAIATAPPRIWTRDLSTWCLANGMTRWHLALRADYHTDVAHRLSDALRPGYFNDASDLIREGDWIDVSAHDGAATLYVVEARGGVIRCEMLVRTAPRGEVGPVRAA